jgi:hypothetical protein
MLWDLLIILLKEKRMGSNYAGRHPSVKEIMKFIEPNPNLKGLQASIVGNVYELADLMLGKIEDDSPELTAGLRKLLEAKDCFVRASLD